MNGLYKHDPNNEADIDAANRRVLEPTQASTQAEASKYIDFILSTPGKRRYGHPKAGDKLRGFVNYYLVVHRSDERRWTVYLEWIDLKGNGHRELLPHEVVNAMYQRMESIIAECKSDRAKRAVITRGQQLRPKPKSKGKDKRKAK